MHTKVKVCIPSTSKNVRYQMRKFAFIPTLDTGGFDAVDKDTLRFNEAENCGLDDGVYPLLGVKENLFNGVSHDLSYPTATAFFGYGSSVSSCLGYADTRGECYLYDPDSRTFQKQKTGVYTFKTVTCYAENGDFYSLLLLDDGVYKVDGNGINKMIDSKTAKLGCIVGERFFYAESREKIVYSAPMDYANVLDSADEGGYLILPSYDGKLVALASVDGVLVIFREYGLEAIEARGASRDFKRRKVAYPFGKIYGDSVVEGANGVWFTASDGVYFFDGKKVERKAENLAFLTAKLASATSSTYFDGKYFVCVGLANGQSKTLVVDGKSGAGCVFSYLSSLSKVTDRLYACIGGKCVYVTLKKADTKWSTYDYEYRLKTPKSDFGIEGEKTLESIVVDGEGVVTLNAFSNNSLVTKTLTLDDGASWKTDLKGTEFALEFVLEKGSQIRFIELTFAVAKKR